MALAAYGHCPFRFEVRSNLHRQRRLQSLLVPKRDPTDPPAHKRLEFDTLLELGSVHALQVETVDLKWHEVVHRVLTGRVSGRNLSSDRSRQSRRHVDDRSSLCVVCLRVAAHSLRAVAIFIVRGQVDEFVAPGVTVFFFFTFGWCSHERTQSTDAPNEQCDSAGGLWLD